MGKRADFENARDYILNRMANELPAKLTYHSLEHTTMEVAPAVERLSTLENVDEEKHLLLLTAAYYHDAGFIYQRKGHETISLELANETLPGFGYSEGQLIVIRGIIQATCIPQSPTNLLEQIMADADLDYLGQYNFWKRSTNLRHELENYGDKFTDEDWYRYQIRFIKAHQYFTASQHSLRDAAKQRHLQEIQSCLEQIMQVRASK